LYIARYAAGEVAVVSPQGTLLQRIKLKGQKPTNVAFGGDDGKTVYVTLQDRGAIETFRSELPGREWLLQAK
ncbi:MAG TPA: SMP-30/gluconolactonase/LRE family protein, partial [Cellvibrio sp.]